MAQIIISRHINAPIEDIWESWDDFGEIAKFHPGIKGSHLINGSARGGKGADRQCNLSKDGKKFVRERVVSSIPNRQMVVDIYDGTVPLKRAQATLDFKQMGMTSTHVQMTMDFTPGMGILGWLMTPMMKAQFKGMLKKVLASNEAFVINGTTVQ